MEGFGETMAAVVAEGDPILKDIATVGHRVAISDMVGVEGNQTFFGKPDVVALVPRSPLALTIHSLP